MPNPIHILIKCIRSLSHEWRLVTIEFAAAESKHIVVAGVAAEIVSMRAAIDALAQIEQMGSDALLEVPAAADLVPGIVRARMVAVYEIATDKHPLRG